MVWMDTVRGPRKKGFGAHRVVFVMSSRFRRASGAGKPVRWLIALGGRASHHGLPAVLRIEAPRRSEPLNGRRAVGDWGE